ncbi:MAG TPA: DUF418 domain-containing protein [Caldimonas sp.]
MSAADSTRFADAEAPLAEPDRSAALDVLRGFALLGIFIMNMPGFSHSLFAAPTPPSSTLDAFVAALRDLFFAGKFNLLFGFVFGVGFAIQMARLENAERARAARLGAAARPRRPAHVYLRRLAFLAVVGLVHAMLLWSGDVLVIYALLGVALLALRRLDDRGFAILIVACLLFPALAEVLRPVFFSAATATIAAFEYQQLEASNDVAFGHGSFLDAVRETARIFAWSLSSPLGLVTTLAFSVQMATGIFAGYVVGRRGWPARPLSAPLAWRLLAGALVVAIGGNAIAAIGGDGLATAVDDRLASFVTVLARTLGRAALAALYVLAVVRVVGAGTAPQWLRPLQQAGRMPLTNYLLQTLLATFCFYGWGLGWWGRGGAAFETALAIALFVCVQLPLAMAWLSRHRAGPVETIWRFFTYGPRHR